MGLEKGMETRYKIFTKKNHTLWGFRTYRTMKAGPEKNKVI